jgi:hypothetical protein
LWAFQFTDQLCWLCGSDGKLDVQKFNSFSTVQKGNLLDSVGKWKSGYLWYRGLSAIILLNEHADCLQVIIAYIMELSLAIVLSTGVLFVQPSSEKGFQRSIHRAFHTYADAAIVFTFSIQLASLIILAKKDFGVSAQGLGGYSVEITWSAALVTMLPVTLLCFVHTGLRRQQLRLGMICVSWGFFMYTFLSRMVAVFGISQIGTSDDAVIAPSDWEVIVEMCFGRGEELSSSKRTALDVFAIGGSLFVSLIILGLLVWPLFGGSKGTSYVRSLSSRISGRLSSNAIRSTLILNVALWGCPQIWAILCIRAMQARLARSVNGVDLDHSWSFGQIFSVVVFLPVFVDFAYSFLIKESDVHLN